jgi:NADH dehydrogenase/NADH:ubiquinone oxidoreductase subunit G
MATAAKVAEKVASKLLHASVNGRIVQVPTGATLLDAIKAAGARVPTLCYHPSFPASATCRMCLVQVDDTPGPYGSRRSGMKTKLAAACHTPIQDGMILTTDSKELQQFRKTDLQFLLARHPNECMRCEASGNCKLQDLVQEYQVEEIWPKSDRGSVDHPEHLLYDHTSPAIARDMAKCIECGLCVKACEDQQINAIGFAERGSGQLPITTFDKPLSETNCISCGQCTLRCPVGALTERPDWQRVLKVLDSKRRTTIVQTAPATRVAIGEEFGFEPGTVSTGRLVNALRALGFDYVTDTNFSADVTIMEEANELLARIRGEKPHAKLPLFTRYAILLHVKTTRYEEKDIYTELILTYPVPVFQLLSWLDKLRGAESAGLDSSFEYDKEPTTNAWFYH